MKLRPFQLLGLAVSLGLALPAGRAADAAPAPVAKVDALPFPGGPAPTPALTLDEVTQGANRLEAKIGGYPPRLQDEADRKQTYDTWSRLVLSAQALRHAQGDTEPVLVVLAQLYREGHNLEVSSAAPRAFEVLKAGEKACPDSIPLSWQASYLYLQLDPKFAPHGEKALLKLRRLLHTDEHPDVERGLLFAYLYENRLAEARKQAEKCARLLPNDPMIKQTLGALRSGNVEQKQN